MMKFDLHIHSKYSKDSFMEPKRIIGIAKKRGLSGIAITDHNTISGSLEAERVNKDNDFIIVRGSEIKTEYGDIIGLFIRDEIKVRNFLDVYQEIKKQGGLVILPHPYSKNTHFPEELISQYIDIIEVLNSRQKEERNKKAFELAKRYNKPISAGSDAHSYFEIGKSYIILEEEIKNVNDLKSKLLKQGNRYSGKITPYYLSHGLSILYEKIKNYL